MACSGWRARWRRAVAMLSRPVSRRIEMAVLRRVAMTCAAWPVRTWERSSSLSRPRDNDDYSALGVMPP